MTTLAPYPCVFGSLVDYPTSSVQVLYNPSNYPRTNFLGGSGSVWSYNGTAWTQFAGSGPAGTIPSDRTGQTMSQDGTNLVLFGGEGTIAYLGDTWKGTNSSWSQSTATWFGTAPYPRTNCQTTYLSGTPTVVLFGGASQSFVNQETWTWTSSNGYWTNLGLASTAQPPWRQYACFAADPTHAILFGGQGNGNQVFQDTWQFSGGLWSDLNTINTPSARWGASFVYDSTNSLFTMFGGCQISNSVPLNETWVFNLGTLTWTNLSAGLTNAPSARYGASACWDSTHHKMLLFSGANQDGLLPDFWTFSGGLAGTWVQVF
jgi:hypothetical protein